MSLLSLLSIARIHWNKGAVVVCKGTQQWPCLHRAEVVAEEDGGESYWTSGAMDMFLSLMMDTRLADGLSFTAFPNSLMVQVRALLCTNQCSPMGYNGSMPSMQSPLKEKRRLSWGDGLCRLFSKRTALCRTCNVGFG